MASGWPSAVARGVWHKCAGIRQVCSEVDQASGCHGYGPSYNPGGREKDVEYSPARSTPSGPPPSFSNPLYGKLTHLSIHSLTLGLHKQHKQHSQAPFCLCISAIPHKAQHCCLGLVGKEKAGSLRLTWTAWVQFQPLLRRRLPALLIISRNWNDDGRTCTA